MPDPQPGPASGIRPPSLGRSAPQLRTARPRTTTRLSLDLAAVPPPPSPSSPPPAAAAGEDEFRRLFLEEAAGDLRRTAEAIARGDWEAARRGFHTVRGGAATFGFTAAAEAAARGEKAAAAADAGSGARNAPSHLTALGREVDAALGLATPWAELPEGSAEPGGADRGPLAALHAAWEAWQAGAPGAAAEARAALPPLQERLRASGQEGMARSFEAMAEFFALWGDRAPPPPMTAVVGRCLADAAAHLAESDAAHGPRPAWRRRWNLIFRSLQVALAAAAPAPAAAGAVVDRELLEAFTEEAGGLFAAMEQAVLRWEQGRDPAACRAELRRHFHTLKGAANSVGLSGLGAGFHFLEDRMQSGADPRLSQLLRCLDEAKGYLGRLQTDPAAPWTADWSAAAGAAGGGLDPEMVAAFVEEAQGLLDPLEALAMEWERGGDAGVCRSGICRHLHTLKGAANSVGLRALGASLHELEDSLGRPESSGAQGAPQVLACAAELRRHLRELEKNPSAPWQGGGRGGEAAAAAGEPAAEAPSVRVDPARLRQVLAWTGGLVAEHAQAAGLASRLAGVKQDLDLLRARVVAHAEEARAGHAPGPEAWTGIEQALSTASAALAELRQQTSAAEARRGQAARQIQSELADFNMAPVGGLFRRLQRVFRDALQAEGKEADLVLEGARTRLDRAVAERLYSPLLHILRNAVAHGIEPPERRAALGKLARGRVRLAAVAQPGHVVLEVEDDGAGIRPEAVCARAVARGLLPPGTESVTPDEAVRLLFTPGFSTKETANDVAGRGVGLDVVKAEIESMNGSVAVRSTPGAGAVWSVRVPLHLSASEALIVRAGVLEAALPLGYVVRCVRLEGSALRESGGRVVLGDEGLPYYALHELLGSSAGDDPSHGVIVDAGAERAVFGVHAVLERREVVRRDPGPLLSGLSFLSGACTTADGGLIALLQVPELLRRLGAGDAGASAPQPFAGRILLVDDSSSVRRAHRALAGRLGAEVDEAASADEALRLLRAGGYRLVLTDLEMPGMDGLGLVREMKADAALAGVPVVVVTSRREASLLRQIQEAGAGWLPKPLDLASLRREVSRLVPGPAPE